MKNIRLCLSENFQFLEVKFSIYLNRRVFVMILHIHKVSSGHLLSNETFYSILRFYLRTAKAPIRLCGCAWLNCAVAVRICSKIRFRMARPIYVTNEKALPSNRTALIRSRFNIVCPLSKSKFRRAETYIINRAYLSLSSKIQHTTNWYFLKKKKKKKKKKTGFDISSNCLLYNKLIRVFAVSMKKAWVLSYPLSAQ